MESKLEKKSISKRKELTVKNDFTINNVYEESKSKKGGNETGSLVKHINSLFDTSIGGGKIDVEERNKQLLYVTPGQTRYTKENGYLTESNEPIIKIDDTIEGQYIVY